MSEPETTSTAAETPALGAPASARLDSANSLIAVGVHVGGLFTSVLVPIVVFLLARDDAKLAWSAPHAREALNYQITLFIAAIVLFFSVIGWILLPVLVMYDIACVTIAAIKAINGEHWRYPLTLRLIK